MKSPLVDALRQANDSGRSGDETDTLLVDDLEHDSALTANEDYPREEPLNDLELLEATGVLHVDPEGEVSHAGEEPANESLAEEMTLEDETAGTADDELPADEEEQDEQIQLSTSRALTATQALRQTSLAVEAPPIPLTKDQPMTGVMRIGRFSPLICVSLAGIAAGMFLLYAILGGAYENTDIRALPSQVDGANDAIAQFEEAANPFQLIVNSQPAEDVSGSAAK